MSDQNGNGSHAELIDVGAPGTPLPEHLARLKDRRGRHDRGRPVPVGSGYECALCERPTDEQGLALDETERFNGPRKACKACFGGMLNTPDMADPEVRLVMKARGVASRRRGKPPRLSDLLDELVRDELNLVFKPYFDILRMEPNPDWSERTKMDFKQGQVSVAEKLLNRTEGLPTQRIRNVDSEDNDVLPQVQGLPAPVQERLLVGLFTGNRAMIEDVRAALADEVESSAEEVTEEEQPPPEWLT